VDEIIAAGTPIYGHKADEQTPEQHSEIQA
jgi:hypothetical protein